MVNPYLQRPQRPNQPRPNNNPNRPQQPGNRDGNRNNNNNNRGGGGGHNPGGGGNNPEPSPWLIHNICTPHETASFVEYLRWMRESNRNPGQNGKDATDPTTKLQIMQTAEEKPNYQKRLELLNARTKCLAGSDNCFEVTCPWRIRVGGAKGPESMLLPAFDHVGMPYIPSSTLRGVARAQGIREFMAQGMSRSQAAEEIGKYLGDLDAENKDKAGKVIFFDAYPIPSNKSKSGGLAVDIANNIWSWNGNHLQYSPNPNVFFSLRQAQFLIGIRKGINCTDEVFTKVKQWLIAGLEQGAGSQINSGYGRLIHGQPSQNPTEFLRLKFTLEGQLIHGRQKFTQWNWNANRSEWQHRGASEAEVRPVAFKNMLRYWFRAFGLGVLVANQVQEWEGKLFGAITPNPMQGWIRVEILDGRIIQREPRPNQQGKNDPVGQQSGVLVLSLSHECPDEQKESVKKLFLNLTWLMFHLGGVGQGARRPCYSRQNRDRAPWWRGSSLIPETQEKFWELPDTPKEFGQLMRTRITNFFEALAQISHQAINYRNPINCGKPNQQRWTEAVDAHCRIVISSGSTNGNKPYALAKLHDIGRRGDNYDRFLCGGVQGGVIPSPVWIADFDGYEVVTVFGATAAPRTRYVEELTNQGAIQVFPFT